MKRLSKVIISLVVMGAIAFTLVNNKKELNVKDIDSKKLAVFIKQEDGSYKESTSIPQMGYTLNTNKSTCSNGAKPTWINNTLNLSNLTEENTNCYLYFDTICKEGYTACQSVLNNKVIKVRDKIDGPLTENTTGSIYAAEDNDGMSYYFAGAVDNNWVKFAGNYWRIIRVNGNGSIRMIYNGPTMDQIGETTQIGTSAFNEQYDDNAYVGYMYGTPGSSTYEETHANINDSTIKKVVDNWYKDNIANNTNYSNKIDINSGFCNDRQLSSGLGYSKSVTEYAFFSRVSKHLEIIMPTYKCTNNDNFSLRQSIQGNKKLEYPIGLISTDEEIFAGAYDGIANNNYFLFTGQIYWTMSPQRFDSGGFSTTNNINDSGGPDNDWVSSPHAIRPVINLKSDVLLTGNGTIDNPFVVEGAE